MPIGELCAVAAAVTWAIGSILFARIGRAVVPGAMNLGKLLVAGVLLSLTHVALGGSIVSIDAPRSAILLLAASGVAGLTIGDTAYFSAMESLGVSRAVLLLSTAPVFTALGGLLWLGERIDGRAAIGMALAIVGVSLVVTGRTAATTATSHENAARPVTARGLAYGLLAAIGQSAGSLLSRRAMQDGVDPLAASAIRLLVGAIGLFFVAMVIGRSRVWIGALRRDRAWLKVGAAALVGSYAGIWLAQTALKKAASAGVAATLLATTPVFALPLAHVVGIDRLTRRAALGAAIALAGIVVLSLR